MGGVKIFHLKSIAFKISEVTPYAKTIFFNSVELPI